MKPIIDFDIINIDQLERLLVIDQSEWKHLENEPAILEVTIPGSKTPFALNFTKGVNRINSYTVNLITPSCKDCKAYMQDGVYTITLKICGKTKSGMEFSKTKYFLRTFEFYNKLDQILDKKGINEQPYKNYLIDAMLFIEKAKSSLRTNKINSVMSNYNEADKLIDKIIKDLGILIL